MFRASSKSPRDRSSRRFFRLCRRHRFPKPEVNVWIGPYQVDFLWRDRRLVVETDGWETHGTRSASESDRGRDAELESLGYRVVRFTYRQAWYDGDLVAGRLRSLLS
jgi:very-short-patch-repair endonuclease